MLKIPDAFKFAFSEFRQKTAFWAELCVLYVAWSNISGILHRNESIGSNWLLLIVTQIVDLVVYAGIVNVAVLASGRQSYSLRDALVKADKLWRFVVVALIPAFVIVVLTFLLAHSSGISAALLGSIMLLVVFILFIKFSFVPFYLMEKNDSIISSIKKSWALSDCQVVVSLFLYFLSMVVAVLPLGIIDMILAPCHISIVSCITPFGLLVLGNLYQQATQKSAAE